MKKLGFGLMRLPKKGPFTDIEQVKHMVDAFLDAGFTYFDTAYVYLGSEGAAKRRSSAGMRGSPILLPPS